MTHTPLSRFRGIPLEFMTNTDGRIADWWRDLRIVSEKAPASNRTFYQADGYTDWELTTRVMLPTLDDWEALEVARGKRGELWMPSQATRYHKGQIIEPWMDIDYVKFQDVLLLAIENKSDRRVNGTKVIATVKFVRPVVEAYSW